ncbi:hypothetical protein KC853_03285, partial [Candidatus Saccharibacteria bacterium]|nr:hypothetical protein [Candidatus Saccharibacteria bacterium]
MKLKRFGSLLARSGLISLVLLMVINLALPLVTSQVRLDQDVISDNHAIILGKVIPRVDAACVIDGENTDQESEEACQDAGGQWLSSLEDQEGGEIDTCYQGGLSLGWIICPII